MLCGIVVALAALVVPSAAFAADGDLVTSFNGTGQAARTFGSSFGSSTPSDAAVDVNGRLVVVGMADGNIGVTRINPDGSYDTSFGGGDGQMSIVTGGTSNELAVAIQPDGKIVIVGYVGSPNQDIQVARLLADGSLDPSFDGPGTPGNGIFTINFTSSDIATEVALDGNRILIGGTQLVSGNPQPTVISLDVADGDFDSTFGSGGSGVFTHQIPGAPSGSFVQGLAAQPDHKVVVGMYPNGLFNMGVARILADGTGLDTVGFNPSGAQEPGLNIVPRPTGYEDADNSDLVLDATGIVIGGTVTDLGTPDNYDQALTRVTSGGVIDSTFGNTAAGAGPKGYAVLPRPGNQFGSDLSSQPDGKLLLGGGAGTPTDQDQFTSRFSSVGALDTTTFGPPDGFVSYDISASTQAVAAPISATGVAYLVGPTSSTPGDDDIGISAIRVFPDPTPPDPPVSSGPPGSTSGGQASAPAPKKKCKKKSKASAAAKKCKKKKK